MPSRRKKWKLKNILTAKIGCGCGPKSTDIVEPKPLAPKPTRSPSSVEQSILEDEESYASCPETLDHATTTSNMVSPCSRFRDSFAMEKDSEDPYQDFRHSMLQMIFEKEIYSGEDLQQLLQCFLELNSPQFHGVIVRAFMEIWNGGVIGGPSTSEVKRDLIFVKK